MLPREGGERVALDDLAALLRATAGIEGLSLLGGEPFAQPAACAILAEAARAAGLSVMIFTGFTLEELAARREEPGVAALLDACDVLVDGPYDRALPERKRRWVGSSNQRTHFLTARYAPDDPRFMAANTVEVRIRGGTIVVNGWPEGAAALLPVRGAHGR
jgi:anaerobic ribonucleoside-triphosphate reductase activating protein